MTLPAGARLGPYEVVSPLGSGGMGEVCRARDTRLDRAVAIKVLPARTAADPEALARFRAEARAVAALSHPNILALHDIGQDGEVCFAVTELLDGETLRSRIAAGPLPWRRAAAIAVQIADGLAAAHAKGIVHRDLKPENVFLTADGRVKILDFGLARRETPAAARGQDEGTTATALTGQGVILGTVGYMSPEQVRGARAEATSDLFSLGCVLYEMVSGRRAFSGATAADTLAAILRTDPPELAPPETSIPPELARVIGRCLEKNAAERFQSARDLAFALEELLAMPAVSAVRSAPLAAPLALRGRRAVAACVAIAFIALAAGLYWTGALRRLTGVARGPSVRIGSIAVLPLVNLSGDAEQEYFADGMTEELITQLARVGALRVTSRTSVMAFKSTKKTVPQIASELGVDAIVEGSVVRSGQRIRINAQLIEAAADRHLWADTYERDLHDILALQGEVARSIASAVEVSLTPVEKARLEGSRRVDPQAYDATVRGRYLWNKRDEESLRKAMAQFQQAIETDPTYAVAYVGLADCYNALGYSNYLSPEDSFPRAKAAASRALELDSALGDAHGSLGYATMYFDWDFRGAEQEFRRAIELDPNAPSAHQWYAYLLTAMERPTEARGEIGRARQLDPLSAPISTDMAFTYYYAGRPEEAIPFVKTALEMNPRFPIGHFWLGRIYTSQGRYDDAFAELTATGVLRSWQPTMAALGFLYGVWGKQAEARKVLEEFDSLARQGRYQSSYAVALVHAGLGDRPETFRRLEKAYGERSHWLVWLKLDPRWDTVRADPRFLDLLRRVGLPGSERRSD